MTAPLFLADHAVVASARAGVVVALAGPEGRHAVGVRRLQVGEALDVGDGRGTVLHCRVAAITGRDSLAAETLSVEVVPAPRPRVVVVQALPKGDRGEVAVETLTEVGVDVIVPWAAQRCVARWTGDRVGRGLARWTAVATAAGKQSRRAWLPQVAPLAGSTQVIDLVRGAARAVVLHEGADLPLGAGDWPEDGDIVLVVGPEGGVTDEELATLASAGADVARMGPTVMRSSTAGTVAAGVVLAATARWGAPGRG